MIIKFEGNLEEIILEMESVLTSLKKREFKTLPKTQETVSKERPRDRYRKLVDENYETLKGLRNCGVRWFESEDNVPKGQCFAVLSSGAIIGTNYSNVELEKKIKRIESMLEVYK